ncbi:MAG: exopolygalacturonase, partial [Alistipes sp.]|nr:exopolygalacturonase [Alistipes sp.]
MKRLILMLLTLVGGFTATAAETFPDGKPISDWFYDVRPVDVDALGKRYVLTDYGVKQDSTLLQTEAIQAVINRAASEGGGVIVVPKGV